MIEHEECGGGTVDRMSDIEWKGDQVLFWRGRCRSCGEPVEVQYQLESATTVEKARL